MKWKNLKKDGNRVLAAAAAVAVTIAWTGSAYGRDFADTREHWARQAISVWSDYGVVQGDDRGFRPGDPITRGETATVLDNVVGYVEKADTEYLDVTATDWFADAISKLDAAGVMQGDGQGTIRPRANISREEAVVMFCRAFGLESGGGTPDYQDSAQISDWAKEDIARMSALGYIQGLDGQFRPKDAITRAEIVTVLDNMVGLYATEAKTYSGDFGNKLAMIKMSGVTVSGAVLGGAVISPQVGGRVTFNSGTKISGNLYNLSEDAAVNTTGAAVSKVTNAEISSGSNSGGTTIVGSGSGIIGGGGSGGSSGGNGTITTYKVVYDANGGSWRNGRKQIEEEYTSGFTLSRQDPGEPDREGYVFEGWYSRQSAANSLDKTYEVDLSKKVIQRMTLYAGWSVEPLYFTVGKAPLHDKSGSIADADLIQNYAVSESKGTITIKGSALRKHVNANGAEGYWVGAAIKLPEQVADLAHELHYYFGNQEMTMKQAWEEDDVLENILDADHKNTVMFYTNVGADEPNRYISIELPDKERQDFVLDLTGVTLAAEAKASFGAVITAADDESLLGKPASALMEKVTLNRVWNKVNTYSAAGTLNYVTGYTDFAQDTQLQEGNYLALTLTLPASLLDYTKVSVKVSGADADDTNFTAESAKLTKVFRIQRAEQEGETPAPIVFTVDFDGEEEEYAPSSYTVELDELTLAPKPAETPEPESEPNPTPDPDIQA